MQVASGVDEQPVVPATVAPPVQPDPSPEIRIPPPAADNAAVLRRPFIGGPRRPNSWRHPGGTVSETEESEFSEAEAEKQLVVAAAGGGAIVSPVLAAQAGVETGGLRGENRSLSELKTNYSTSQQCPLPPPLFIIS